MSNDLLPYVLPHYSIDWLSEEPTTSEPTEILRQMATVEDAALAGHAPSQAVLVRELVQRLHQGLVRALRARARSASSGPAAPPARRRRVLSCLATLCSFLALAFPVVGLSEVLGGRATIVLPFCAAIAAVGAVAALCGWSARVRAGAPEDLRKVFARGFVLTGLAAALMVPIEIGPGRFDGWPLIAIVVTASCTHIVLYALERRRLAAEAPQDPSVLDPSVQGPSELVHRAQEELDGIFASLPEATREACRADRDEGLRELRRRGTFAEFTQPELLGGALAGSLPFGRLLVDYAVFCAEQQAEQPRLEEGAVECAEELSRS